MQLTMKMRNSDWENALSAAAKNGSAHVLLALITNELAGLAGTPRQALQHSTVQYIEAALDNNSPELVRLAETLADTGQELGQELAVFILSVHYGAAPERSSELLKRMAASEHTQVRDWTSSACGAILTKHFQSFYPKLESWIHDESPFVRRAVASAVRIASNAKNPAWGSPLLDLLEPLMRDNDAVVRKEFSPRIWGGLLRYFAPDVESRLIRWAVSDDRNVRRHAAKLFSAPEAALHIQRLGPALRILLRDEAAPVQKAAVSSLLQLSKRIRQEEAAEFVGAIK